MPRICVFTIQHELDNIIKLSVLLPQQKSGKASPSFIILKNNGSVSVCWIGDLHQLNKYEYTHLPMGLKFPPNIAPAVMEEVPVQY